MAKKKGATIPLFLSDPLLDFCLFANSASEVIELCPSHLTASDGIHRDDGWRMDGEYFFTSDVIGYTPDSDSFVYTAMLFGDNSTLESLIPFPVAFLDAHGDPYSVSDVHRRQLRFHVLSAESLDQIHRCFPPFRTDVHTAPRR